jgi:hypothetical protein
MLFIFYCTYLDSRQDDESFSCEYYQVFYDFSFTVHVIHMELVISEITLMKYIVSVQALHAVLSQEHNIPHPCFLLPYVTSYTFVCVEKRDLEVLLL